MRVAEIEITLRSAIGPKITARELVSRARVYLGRTRACTREEGRCARRERETKASEREREEKEEEKESEPREVVRIQSSKLAGERVIAFRDYDVEFVALCPFFLPCNLREDKKGKGATERKITRSHEILRESAAGKQGNYNRR